MIVDSSALVAVLRDEKERDGCLNALERADTCRLSAANFLEAAIVIDASRDPALSRRLDQLIDDMEIVIEPVTEAQARIAREAYRDFGRRSGHPASLNFGDCFAYALAKAAREPLLFKGDDFGHTDVEAAVL